MFVLRLQQAAFSTTSESR